MPEVTEVRKYADFIKDKFKNKILMKVNILQGRYKKHGPFENYNQLTRNLPLKILDVKTKGKFMYFILEKGFYIFCTLGLRGGWVYLKDKKDINYLFPDLVDYLGNYDIEKYKKVALDHLNIEFITSNGILYFFDHLSFGTLKVVNKKENLDKKLNALAPDIMDLDTKLPIFKEQILKPKNLNKPIGNVLMDQKVISGIGNYLRADILWLSKISPFRKVKDLTDKEIEKLYKNSILLTWGEYDKKYAMEKGLIKKSDKLPDDYKREFFVYFHDTDIYGNPVIREELYEGSQQRFIYWVKKVQK
jgi:formamidopyrimidine-DNA glycosylase